MPLPESAKQKLPNAEEVAPVVDVVPDNLTPEERKRLKRRKKESFTILDMQPNTGNANATQGRFTRLLIKVCGKSWENRNFSRVKRK